ncbi:MAG: hypothetical protein OMM_10308, partial [Candidatus Magnetoglobus multicellularis str. Araruama]
SIENQSTFLTRPLSIPFQITDTEGGYMQISVSSSLHSLVSPESIYFTGPNITTDGQVYAIQATSSIPEYITMVIQPNSDEIGSSVITITVDTAQVSFVYSVLSLFSEDDRSVFPGVRGSSVAFGDYDNDGDLDILLTGVTNSIEIAKVYRNTDGIFTEDTNISLPGISNGSVAFGDYDNDNDLDILLAGNGFSKIFKNTDGTFSEDTNINLPGVYESSVAFGDIDNDGDLDILLTGGISAIIRNIDGNFNEATDIQLPNVNESSVAFGDMDNDGDLDIIVTGGSVNQFTSRIYRNTDGLFTEDTEINLYDVAYSSAAFGDIDNDQDLDLIITGYPYTTEIARIYRNINGILIIDNSVNLYGAGAPSSEFGDYDNDGDLDLLISGILESSTYIRLYQNIDDAFNAVANINLPAVNFCSTKFGDYDNDGDLDIFITGASDSGYIAKLYRNNLNIPNTPPTAPGNLNATVSNNNILLSWSASSDAETFSATGLNYNLRIGSTPGACDILSPMSLPLSHGYRLMPARGMIQNLTATINNLSDGTYYWSVQAIDTAFAGSEFSATSSFVIGPTEKHFTFTPPSTNYYMFFYGDVFTINGLSAEPGDEIAVFDQQGTICGHYVLSNADGFVITVYGDDSTSGKDEGATYYEYLIFKIWDASLEIETTLNDSMFIQKSAFGAPQIETIPPQYEGNLEIRGMGIAATNTNLVPELSQIENQHTIIDSSISIPFQLTDTQSGSLQISVSSSLTVLVMPENIYFTGTNITSDGTHYTIHVTASEPENITMIVQPISGQSGESMITITIDNGAIVEKAFAFTVLSPFTENTNITLPGVENSATAFGDYDNDGDLDILIAGSTDNGDIAKVFQNTAGHFTEVTSINLSGVSSGSAIFGDYDNDNDLDILLTGSDLTKLYQNVDGHFTEDLDNSLPELSNSSLALGDYDSDGDLDLFMSGDSFVRISKLYQNTDGIFYTDNTHSLTPVSNSSVEFGDYDCDGDLDLLVSDYSSESTMLYKNINGIYHDEFILSNTAKFGDFDNDNDLDMFMYMTRDDLPAFLYVTDFIYNTEGAYSFGGPFSFNNSIQIYSIAFGDYDNDGDLDMLLTGNIGETATIYRNENGIFQADSNISLIGVKYGTSIFGDYDNDGDLDILLTGQSLSGPIAKVYQNNLNTPNTAPSSPTGLTANVVGYDVHLSWSAASDAETISSSGLNYNLYIGSTPGGTDILSPMALPLSNGYRLLPARGHIQTLTTTIKNLTVGTYYWGVQAIDTAFKGSEFSTGYSFTVMP